MCSLATVFFKCLNICGSRHDFLVVLQITVIKACACKADDVRDLQDRCSNLAPILLAFPQLAQNCVQCISCLTWTQLNTLSSTQILLTKLKFGYQDTYGETFIYKIFYFHIRILQKSQLFKRVFHDINSVL